MKFDGKLIDKNYLQRFGTIILDHAWKKRTSWAGPCHYPYLHLHMEGGEEIDDKSRPHVEYTRAIYPYITDSVSCLTLDGPLRRFIQNLS